MFDLRYHVASLVAVFVALVIGILVGVGLSGRGFVSDSERSLLNAQIRDLQARLDAASQRGTQLARNERAAEAFVDRAYATVMQGRLRGLRVAVIFVGSVDGRLRSSVRQTLRDAGADDLLRIRALRVPLDPARLRGALARRPALLTAEGDDGLAELGRGLAGEFVAGGRAPLWNALAPQLVAERSGDERSAADAVVVARSARAQHGATAQLLAGFYAGLAAARVPTVAIETTDAAPSTIEGFRRRGLSTVDAVDLPVGRVALALVLGGARRGSYGVKPTARDGVLPEIPPLPAGG